MSLEHSFLPLLKKGIRVLEELQCTYKVEKMKSDLLPIFHATNLNIRYSVLVCRGKEQTLIVIKKMTIWQKLCFILLSLSKGYKVLHYNQ